VPSVGTRIKQMGGGLGVHNVRTHLIEPAGNGMRFDMGRSVYAGKRSTERYEVDTR
jgi:hypothetical protein